MGRQWRDAFEAHPRSVGESYLGHLAVAARFSGALMVASLACLAHGLAPFAFQATGSRQIRRLYAAMVTDRDHASAVLAQR